MTGWHLLKLWGAVTAVGLMAVGGLLLWPLVWPEDPDKAFKLVGGRLVGETEGYVWRVESDQQRIHVTSSLLGLRAVPITVTPDTKIVVNNKLGGLGDIWKGMDVRVSYEVRDSARIATAVELLTTKARRARTTPTEIVVPADAATESLVERAIESKKPAAAPPIAAPKDMRPATQPKAVETRQAETRPVEPRPAVVPTKPVAPAAPTDPDSADGSAAVDWLFKGSRR